MNKLNIWALAGLVLWCLPLSAANLVLPNARRCSLYVLGLIYTCSKFAGLRCPLWIPTVFLNCFAPLPN